MVVSNHCTQPTPFRTTWGRMMFLVGLSVSLAAVTAGARSSGRSSASSSTVVTWDRVNDTTAAPSLAAADKDRSLRDSASCKYNMENGCVCVFSFPFFPCRNLTLFAILVFWLV
jgi:hypothetical protein